MCPQVGDPLPKMTYLANLILYPCSSLVLWLWESPEPHCVHFLTFKCDGTQKGLPDPTWAPLLKQDLACTCTPHPNRADSITHEREMKFYWGFQRCQGRELSGNLKTLKNCPFTSLLFPRISSPTTESGSIARNHIFLPVPPLSLIPSTASSSFFYAFISSLYISFLPRRNSDPLCNLYP